MDIIKFPNPKLNLPKELKNKKENSADVLWRNVENYLNIVGKYIYTEIKLDYQLTDPSHPHAWVQKIMSAYILRSLYIRNQFVDAINARNFVGIFLPLKAWLETVAVLAAILDILENSPSQEELIKRLQPYAIGNKGKGNLRVGEIEAVNVQTMIEKADKYFKKMIKDVEKEVHDNSSNFFTDFYDVASNPSHPSFDAQDMVGHLVKGENRWEAETPDQVKEKLVTDIAGYRGLLMPPLFVRHLCEKILELEKDHFERLKSKKYFD